MQRESLKYYTIRDKRAGREGKKGEDGEREKMRPPPLRAKEEKPKSDYLLSNQTFITSLKEYIKEFLEINMPSDVDPQILWEMTKCAIRGFCISFSSTLAKAKTHQFTQLENKIQSLQNLQKQCFTEQQATQLSSLKVLIKGGIYFT